MRHYGEARQTHDEIAALHFNDKVNTTVAGCKTCSGEMLFLIKHLMQLRIKVGFLTRLNLVYPRLCN
jgi:hypothetical protein